MRFVLTPVGSAGDVHPYLAIGRELRRRGYEVALLASVVFREPVERAGIEFIAVGTLEDYERATRDPDLWHPRHGVRLMMKILGENLDLMWGLLEDLYEPDHTILVGHTIAFASRCFEDKHRLPAATIHLAPNVFRSEFAQPAIFPGVSPSRLPRGAKRLLWRSLDRFLIDPMIAPVLNAFRGQKGLSPVSRVFHSWLHSPQRVLALFPEWFAPRQPDWPEQLRVMGFALYDDAENQQSDPALEEWVANGTPPILFTPGTGNRQAASFFDAAAKAVERLGRRALFLTRFEENLRRFDRERIRHAPYIPFSRVLHRCAALVHHGGIGTCAQGLAAGIPQLVMPMGFDQPDNAERLVNLGVGSWISPKRFSAKRVERKLAMLLGDPKVRESSLRYRERMANEDGVARACNELENLVGQRGL